ncbi:protein AGENET DOMAIN (AGD)-CONTAINING P1-like [Nicotiana tomentosiformis]|uniref:protein AGENET DOMAIN (AGD)-CONTAINING P1-like n=1 Tax=Nicotiana tomentosiformis TaxID=4098 RepID=UPI00388CCCA7
MTELMYLTMMAELKYPPDVLRAHQEWTYKGSYYEATIVSRIGTSRYKVRYKTLLTKDESELLEEIVTDSEVRPVPPHIAKPEGGFRLYDGVDVFDNDGWWFGFIYRKTGSDYIVYFPTTNEELAYPHDVLRAHQEWTYKGE